MPEGFSPGSAHAEGHAEAVLPDRAVVGTEDGAVEIAERFVIHGRGSREDGCVRGGT